MIYGKLNGLGYVFTQLVHCTASLGLFHVDQFVWGVHLHYSPVFVIGLFFILELISQGKKTITDQHDFNP